MKKYSVVFTPDAENNIDGIYEYIAIDKGLPDVAITYVRKLQDACYKLENIPVRGRNREDIRANLRILALDKSAVAAFEVDEKQQIVTILGIFYGGQDYEVIVGDE